MSVLNSLPIGSILHGENYNYKIEKVLGQGSFGITYKALISLAGSLGRLQSDIPVAIKEFFMRDINTRQGIFVGTGSDSVLYHNYRKDFIREANHISKLNNPHIVKVLEAFEENNTAYFVMEYIDGGSLDSFIQSNNGLDEHEALENVLQISEALSYMHENMMLHLDLKPLNIMRNANGELVLIDFGLSKQFNLKGEPESSTRIGNGTMGYAPIEQANYRREDGFSPTLDIYALGATLYKMLMGIAPPDASTVLNNGFPETAMRSRGISQDVIELTSWTMEPMKRMRPQSVSDVVTEINRILQGESYSHRKQHDIQEETIIRQDDTDPAVEFCNGFHVCWSNGISESKKSQIRDLLNNMKKIGEKERYINSEYGLKSLPNLPIMSLGDKTWDCLNNLAIGENTDGIFPSRNISFFLNAIHNLSIWTSLPFRLCNEEEFYFERSAVPGYWDNLQALCYAKDKKLKKKTFGINTGLIEINLLKDFDTIFDVQIVCDGLEPVYNRYGGYKIPSTQPIVDEILPIGFGMYKVRRGSLWIITTPERPMLNLVPESFDVITHVGIWEMPVGGPRHNGHEGDYFGLMAVKGVYTYYYEFRSGEFRLLNKYTEKQIEESKMWT